MISSLFILVACLSPHVVEGTARGGIDSSESTGFATQTRVPVSVSVITPPPSLGELRRRQGLYTSDFLMAADNTCGYYGGNSGENSPLLKRYACRGTVLPAASSVEAT